MTPADLNIAEKIAVFFRDFGVYAALAMLVLTCIYLERARERATREKFELAMRVVPLTERLSAMVARAAQAQARKRSAASTPPHVVGGSDGSS